MVTSWSDEVDRPIDGDLTAALAKRGLRQARRSAAMERLRETPA